MESPVKRCLNCNQPVDDQYCSNCGQSTTTERFNLRYLLLKFIYSFDVDQGVFYTLWLLLRRPGPAIREYIQGHRIGFANPIKLYIITGALATLITFEFNFFDEAIDGPHIGIEFPDWQGYYKYSAKYFSFFTLTAIPFFSFFSWLLFNGKGYNYVEHIILNIYIAVGQFLILILLSPVVFLDSDLVLILYGPANFLYNLVVLVVFFQSFNARGVVVGLLAVGIPQVGVYFFNYIIYRISPHGFWLFLERVFG